MAKRINPKIKEIIKKYKDHLIESGVLFERTILFGSYAKGNPKPWSDIDLCIVSTQFGKDRFDERLKLMKLTIGINDEIEPHPYHPKDLLDKWDSLAVEINKHGIAV